ncbi:hypothetical protein E3P99_02838 [Wallemia hederae]|uniref:Arf-GAP domain-containing protein n=1 Tax=Wallemia hederae TaxID=1540922 RepID=A0A4V6TMC1_9BASI|nr:hypothetical protein E3P99_02838 [Wallemia hederae]
MSGVSKQQSQAERNHRRLLDILKVPGNGQCADCKASNPRWASYSLGIFLCMPCASVHRKLGTHISKVKSVTLDNWNREQTASMEHIGNARSNSIYNPDEIKNPPPTNSSQVERDSELEIYIRNKYIHKLFIRKSKSIPPPSKGILKATNTGSSTGSNNSAGLGADLNANTSLNSRSSASPLDGLYKQRSASLQAINGDPWGANGSGAGPSAASQPLINFEDSNSPQIPLQGAQQTLSPQHTAAATATRSFSLPAQLMPQQTGQQPLSTGSLVSSPQSFQQSTLNTQPTPFSLNSPMQSTSTLQPIPQSNSPYQNAMSSVSPAPTNLYSHSPTSNPVLSQAQSSASTTPYTTPFQMHQNGINSANPAPLRSQGTGVSSAGSMYSLNSQSTGAGSGSGIQSGFQSGMQNGMQTGMQSPLQNGLQSNNLHSLQPQQTGLRSQSSFSNLQSTGGLPGSFQSTLQSQPTGMQTLQPQPTGKRDWPAPPSAPSISPMSQQQSGLLSASPSNGSAMSGGLPSLSSSPGGALGASNSPFQRPPGSYTSPYQQQQQGLQGLSQGSASQPSQSPFSSTSPFQQRSPFSNTSIQTPTVTTPPFTTTQPSQNQLTPTQSMYSASTLTQLPGQQPVQTQSQQFMSPAQNSPFGGSAQGGNFQASNGSVQTGSMQVGSMQVGNMSQPFANTANAATNQPLSNTNTRTTTTTFIQQPINTYQPTQQSQPQLQSQSQSQSQPQLQQFNANPFQTMMRPPANTNTNSNPFQYSFN